MDADWVRKICLKLPQTTEKVQWGADLVFKVADKMFAVTCLEPSNVQLSFKATPEDFAELTERPGIIPAPYMARAHWVGLESFDAIRAAELRRLIEKSYALVVEELPKKTRLQIEAAQK